LRRDILPHVSAGGNSPLRYGIVAERMAETRKLAAILAADVVGYSRLAGSDEDRTLARLRALRSDLIDPTIAVHYGRVVKRTGDGILVEFRSVVEAVRCAIEVQNGMIERNAGLPPERRIEFRVGIHLGDVVEENDGDLMGNGVNIAARLEGVAKPGTICLSEDAYRQVRTRLDLAVSDLGETRLKNIAEPIRIYSLQVGLPPQAKPATPERAASEKPSEPLAQSQTAAQKLWPSDIVRYFAAPLAVLLIAHHVIVNSFDLDTAYLWIACALVPFAFGFALSWLGCRGSGTAFAFAIALGIVGVVGMTLSQSLKSGDPIMPQTRYEWWDNVNFATGIALSFIVGHSLARGLRVLQIGKLLKR
jgi:class 3 adenylate cyclase